MNKLLRFALNIHVPLFLLSQLLFAQDLPQDLLHFLLSLNIAFLLTSWTFISFYSPKQTVYGASIQLPREKNRQKSLVFSVFIGWILFFYLYHDYISGVQWISLAYVICTTWLSWFLAFRNNNDQHNEVMPPLGMVAFELFTVLIAIVGGYALYDSGFVAYELWVWSALIFVNFTLVWNELVFVLYRYKIVSKKTVGYLLFLNISLVGLPIFVARLLGA